MHIEHELRKRALEPREATLQHHEACARQFRGGLEIHLPERLAEIEMLLWREAVIALGAEAMVLDVAARILAVRHFGQRHVRDLRKRVVERVGELLFFRLERRDLGLQARDFGEERLRRRFLVAFLRGADLPRRRVAAGERGLRLLDGAAPALVDFDQPLCFALQPAPRQPPVEGGGIVTYPLDLVHVCRRRAPRQRVIHHTPPVALSTLVPDSKARGYWIARMRGRWRPVGKPREIRHSAGLAAALAASLALSAAAFFSTHRTDQIEPS